MKEKTFLFYIIIVVLFTEPVYSQWKKLKTPQLNIPIALYNIVSKGDTIFTGAYRPGTIYRSFDKGINWEEAKTGLPPLLNQVFTLTIADNFVLAGTDSGVFYSNDWGDHWKQSAGGLPNSFNVNSIIKKGNKFYISTEFGVYYSGNLNDNWIPDTEGLPINKFYPSVVFPVRTLVSVDSFLFAGTTDGVYYKNLDSAKWMPANNGIPNNQDTHVYVRKLLTDGTRILASTEYCGGTVYMSNNNGNTWINISNGLPVNSSGCYPNIYSFALRDNLIFAGTEYGIYRSKDNGQHWEPFNNGLPLGPASDLFVSGLQISKNILFASTFKGVYKISMEDSTTWRPAFTGYPGDARFSTLGVNGGNLFSRAYYDYWNGTFNKNYISTDNGENWNEDTSGVLNNIFSFVSMGGKFYGLGNGLFSLTDQGLNWTEIDSGLPKVGINDIEFVNDTSIYAAYGVDVLLDISTGQIYHSTNNGKSWNQKSNLNETSILSIAFSRNTLLVIGKESYHGPELYKSTDYGMNLVKIDSLIPNGSQVSVLDELDDIIFIGTNHGIYSSTDLGSTWQGRNNGLPKDNEGLYLPVTSIFIDKTNPSLHSFIFIILNYNRLFVSSNNGKSWQSIDSGLRENTTALFLIAANENYLFAGTNKGIWQFPISRITSVEQSNTYIPINFSLGQNYPNPFNPSTHIRFSLPQASDITLQVYNALGQEVASLARGRYARGNYAILFDGTKFPSGIYFYSLTTGTVKQTKKMILLK